MLILFCVLVSTAVVSSKTVLSTNLLTTVPPGCEWNGMFYKPGESFQPSPCEFCHCDPAGQAHCAIADCAMPPCVDAVTKPDQCCPVCPNGSNCLAPDGTTINSGETVTLANGDVCSCPTDSFHPHWGAQMAVCAHKDPALQVVSKYLKHIF